MDFAWSQNRLVLPAWLALATHQELVNTPEGLAQIAHARSVAILCVALVHAGYAYAKSSSDQRTV